MRDKEGNTPLHLAVSGISVQDANATAVITALLAAGACLNTLARSYVLQTSLGAVI